MTLKTSLNAQVSISASDTIGCDTLNTFIYLTPAEVYDTISTVSWYLDNTETAVDDTLQLSLGEPGYYKVYAVLDSQNTSTSSRQDLYVFNSPKTDFLYRDTLGTDQYTYIFQAVKQLVDSFSYTYEWRINNETESSSSYFVYSFESTGEFPVQLKMTNNFGCSDSIIQNIRVTDFLVCPNVFTPNMDGYNDYFRVKTNGITIYTFSVFSRSGIKVYESESPSISWDGRSLSGLEMQPGVYYYIIEDLSGNSTESISGFVHLIR